MELTYEYGDRVLPTGNAVLYARIGDAPLAWKVECSTDSEIKTGFAVPIPQSDLEQSLLDENIDLIHVAGIQPEDDVNDSLREAANLYYQSFNKKAARTAVFSKWPFIEQLNYLDMMLRVYGAALIMPEGRNIETLYNEIKYLSCALPRNDDGDRCIYDIDSLLKDAEAGNFDSIDAFFRVEKERALIALS